LKLKNIYRAAVVFTAVTFFLMITAGCGGGFSVGTKTDALTGLKINYKGLSVDDAYLVLDGSKLTSKSVPLGSEVVMYFTGVENFTSESGMTYPGASMLITGPDGFVLLDVEDLFSQYDGTGISKEDAAALSLSLSFGSPMEPGTAYTWKSRIWDKKGDGEIQAAVKLTAE
jgi:hypothetical protein